MCGPHVTPTMMTLMKKKKTQVISVGEDVEKLEPSHTASANVKWLACFVKIVWQPLRKLVTLLTQQFYSYIYSQVK